MPQGKEIGEFTSKSTSLRVTAIDGGEQTIEMSSEGTVSGQLSGTIINTVTFSGTNDRGSYTDNGVGYLDSGDSVQGCGQGVYWLSKPGEWETRGVLTLSAGQNLILEGRIVLATRTWSGKISELE